MLGPVVCVVLRVNLPLSLVTTLYTNPLTIVPLYLLAYEIGSFDPSGARGHVQPPALRVAVDAMCWRRRTRSGIGWSVWVRRWHSATSCSHRMLALLGYLTRARALERVPAPRVAGSTSLPSADLDRIASTQRSGGRQAAVFKSQHPVAAGRQFRVMRDDHDRGPVLLQRVQRTRRTRCARCRGRGCRSARRPVRRPGA